MSDCYNELNNDLRDKYSQGVEIVFEGVVCDHRDNDSGRTSEILLSKISNLWLKSDPCKDVGGEETEAVGNSVEDDMNDESSVQG